jgi:hypothetical protein
MKKYYINKDTHNWILSDNKNIMIGFRGLITQCIYSDKKYNTLKRIIEKNIFTITTGLEKIGIDLVDNKDHLKGIINCDLEYDKKSIEYTPFISISDESILKYNNNYKETTNKSIVKENENRIHLNKIFGTSIGEISKELIPNINNEKIISEVSDYFNIDIYNLNSLKLIDSNNFMSNTIIPLFKKMNEIEFIKNNSSSINEIIEKYKIKSISSIYTKVITIRGCITYYTHIRCVMNNKMEYDNFKMEINNIKCENN